MNERMFTNNDYIVMKMDITLSFVKRYGKSLDETLDLFESNGIFDYLDEGGNEDPLEAPATLERPASDIRQAFRQMNLFERRTTGKGASSDFGYAVRNNRTLTTEN